MIKAFLQIRVIQLKRIGDQLGLLHALLLIGMLILATYFLFHYAEKFSDAVFIVVFFHAFLLMLHLNRPDKDFLQTHFDQSSKLFFLEYSLLSMPFLAVLLFYGHFLLAAMVIVGIAIILSLKIKLRQSTLNTLPQRLIPHQCFEWKSGFRRSLILIFPAWLLAMVFSFLIGSVPIAMILIAIVIFSFYEKGEPLQMLIAAEKPPARFLKQKASIHLLLFSILMLPLALIFFIFHSSLWYIVTIIFVILFSLLLYAIFTKYAFYMPNSKSGAAGFFQALGAAAVFVPVLLPVIWLLTIRFYFKSVKQLNPYLHDFN